MVEENQTLDRARVIDNEQDANINKREFKKANQFATFLKYIELKKRNIFWMALYTLVLFAIFAERAYCNFFPKEHSFFIIESIAFLQTIPLKENILA